MAVPLLDLKPQYQTMKDEILAEIAAVCESQQFIGGPKIEKLEKEIAEYCQAGYGVGVTSGSDALIIALMVSGIKAGDEVITTPFTFFATVGAIARVGATPVFADIDPVTYNIDPAKIEEKITPRTKAIIPVHLFGQAADMDKIMAIAKAHNLMVLEDCAQAIGAECNGKRVGSIGDFGAISFFPSKNLGCFGDGGMVVTNDPEKAALLKCFRNHGQGSTYVHKFVGGNFRLDALQAAILSIKLRYLDSWSDARVVNGKSYNAMFAEYEVPGITVPQVASYANRMIYNQYSILVADGKRDALRAFLTERKIGCNVYYPLPLHLQECFAYLGGKEGDYPVSERISKEILALPIYPESTDEQRREVVSAIAEFMKR